MFTTADGKEWCPKITVGTLLSYQRMTKKNLLESVAKMLSEAVKDAAEGGNVGKKPSLEDLFRKGIDAINLLFGDLDCLVRLCYCSVEDQALRAGVDYETFCTLLDGESTAAMGKEVTAALLDFFQKAGRGILPAKGKGKASPGR